MGAPRLWDVGSAAYAGAGISAALGGVLVDATSPRTVFIGAGIGTMLVAGLSAPRLRGAGGGAPTSATMPEV